MPLTALRALRRAWQLPLSLTVGASSPLHERLEPIPQPQPRQQTGAAGAAGEASDDAERSAAAKAVQKGQTSL